jgi:4-hydroxy-4-methyl-2-oxoglutarate aldolase
MGPDVFEERQLTGLVDPEAVHPLAERVPSALIERLHAVGDLSATVSDVLDLLGIDGVVGASELRPTITDGRIVGTAVTVRKVPRRHPAARAVTSDQPDMGEIEGANQARTGDVLVIEGQPGVSAMGGMMASMALRQGAVGAIVDGGVRDIGHTRTIGFPLWSSYVTPVTGKWRSEVVEIGGPVTIAGKRVRAGDLVIADETGVAFVPVELVGELVERVEALASAEEGYHAALASNVPLAELVRAQRARAQG